MPTFFAYPGVKWPFAPAQGTVDGTADTVDVVVTVVDVAAVVVAAVMERRPRKFFSLRTVTKTSFSRILWPRGSPACREQACARMDGALDAVHVAV